MQLALSMVIDAYLVARWAKLKRFEFDGLRMEDSYVAELKAYRAARRRIVQASFEHRNSMESSGFKLLASPCLRCLLLSSCSTCIGSAWVPKGYGRVAGA